MATTTGDSSPFRATHARRNLSPASTRYLIAPWRASPRLDICHRDYFRFRPCLGSENGLSSKREEERKKEKNRLYRSIHRSRTVKLGSFSNNVVIFVSLLLVITIISMLRAIILIAVIFFHLLMFSRNDLNIWKNQEKMIQNILSSSK